MDSCLLQFGSLEMNASSSSETQATLCTFFGNLRHFIHLFLWEFTVELNEEAALITTGISAHPKHNVCTVGRWKQGDSSGSHSHWGTPRGPRGPPAKQLTNGLFYCESTHAKRLRITFLIEFKGLVWKLLCSRVFTLRSWNLSVVLAVGLEVSWHQGIISIGSVVVRRGLPDLRVRLSWGSRGHRA